MYRYLAICTGVLLFACGCGSTNAGASSEANAVAQQHDVAADSGTKLKAETAPLVRRRLHRNPGGGSWWSPALDPGTASRRSSIPYVPTRHDAVKDLLWLADIGPDDVVYDLGSGDGRIVIAAVRDFGARKAVGIEIKPELIKESRASAAKAGVSDKVEFIEGDLFEADFSQASVVVLYLSHAANQELRARLVGSLKPGSRVVSHEFGMGEWPADKVLDVRTVYLGMYGTFANVFENNPNVPGFGATGKGPNHDVISVWRVPAAVAGVWRGKVKLDSGEGEFVLTLHQRLSGLSGSFRLTGPMNDVSGNASIDLWGEHVRCWCIPGGNGPRSAEIWFDGDLKDGNLVGSLRLPHEGGNRQVQWTGQRSRDIAGVWEWTGHNGSAVQMKIERQSGRLVGTYTDPNMHRDAGKPIPVDDIYDFGGGFYFTVMIGSNGGGVRLGPDTGWLIGEAVVCDGTLSGTTWFYPYEDHGMPGIPAYDAYMAQQKAAHELKGKRVE